MGGKDFLQSLDPNSLNVVTTCVEESLAAAQPDENFELERHGYFVTDLGNKEEGSKPVFNRVTGLKK